MFYSKWESGFARQKSVQFFLLQNFILDLKIKFIATVGYFKSWSSSSRIENQDCAQKLIESAGKIIQNCALDSIAVWSDTSIHGQDDMDIVIELGHKKKVVEFMATLISIPVFLICFLFFSIIFSDLFHLLSLFLIDFSSPSSYKFPQI